MLALPRSSLYRESGLSLATSGAMARFWGESGKQTAAKDSGVRSLLPIRDFSGYVVQKYRPRSGAPSRAFQKWIDQLEEGVGDVLIPALDNFKCQ